MTMRGKLHESPLWYLPPFPLFPHLAAWSNARWMCLWLQILESSLLWFIISWIELICNIGWALWLGLGLRPLLLGSRTHPRPHFSLPSLNRELTAYREPLASPLAQGRTGPHLPVFRVQDSLTFLWRLLDTLETSLNPPLWTLKGLPFSVLSIICTHHFSL